MNPHLEPNEPTYIPTPQTKTRYGRVPKRSKPDRNAKVRAKWGRK